MACRTLHDHLFSPGPKRILALDGGGVRGIFTLQILSKIETIVKQQLNDDTATLSDYFDLIGGTSTGSIIATGLAMGWPVSKLNQLYKDLGQEVFKRGVAKGLLFVKFPAEPLRRALESNFGDRTLGSADLVTGLAIVSKRLDTGSPWVLTNNPKSRYYEQRPGSTATANREYLLRNVIRASTAAPTFFKPEQISIAPDQEGAFVDGGVSPHNNPALQLFLLATVDGYKLNWPVGEQVLQIVSVGTGRREVALSPSKIMSMLPGQHGIVSLASLMDDASTLNETLLQMFSQSPTARNIDRELSTATASGLPKLFSYLRYNFDINKAWFQENLGIDLYEEQVGELEAMDQPSTMALLEKLGQKTAERMVEENHFLAGEIAPG